MSITKKLRFRILQRDNFQCQYCGRSASVVELQLDHVVPRSAGGDDEESNLITACRDCNQGKKATPLDTVDQKLHVVVSRLINEIGSSGAGKRVVWRLRHAHDVGVPLETIEMLADVMVELAKDTTWKGPRKDLWESFWAGISVHEYEVITGESIFQVLKKRR